MGALAVGAQHWRAEQHTLDTLWGLYRAGQYADTADGARVLLAAVEADSGEASLEAAKVLHLLGDALRLSGAVAESRELLERAISIKERELGTEHLETASTLSRLGHLLIDVADYDGAGLVLERAVAISDKASGAPPRSVLVDCLSALGRLRWRTGDYLVARRLHERQLAVVESERGPDHPSVAAALGSLALVIEDMGDYAETRRLYERALKIQEKHLGVEHPSVAITLNNLGALMHRISDYPAAAAYHQRALAIREQLFDREHPMVASSLSNLGELRVHADDLAGARDLYQRSLAIKEKQLGPDHPSVATVLNNLGNNFANLGELERALALHRRALTVREAAFGPEHPEVAKSLYSLGRVLYLSGRLAEARSIQLRALAIREQLFGPEHPMVAASLEDVSLVLWRLGEDAALELALRAETINRDHRRLTARALSEREALNYATERRFSLEVLLTLLAEGSKTTPAGVIWDGLIRSRAVVLDEMAARNRRLQTTADPQILELVASYRDATTALARLTLRGAGSAAESYRQLLAEAHVKSKRLEQELVARSSLLSRELLPAEVGLEEVRASLPQGSAAVAYVRYEHLTASGSQPTMRHPQASMTSYLCFVLVPGASQPAIVPLGPAREVEDLVRRWRSEVREGVELPGRSAAQAEAAYRAAGDELRRKIWDPVASHLGAATRVFVVPDGALHLVALAALPTVDRRYLADDGPVLHYLSAERDLVPAVEPLRKLGGELLALGGPDYDARSLFAALTPAEASPIRKLLDPLARVVSYISPYRGAASGCEAFRGTRFESLPRSLDETAAIAGLWHRVGRGKQQEVLRLSGAAASEAAFKELAVGRRVVHLATHAFFLGGRCASALDEGNDVGDHSATGENPLLLSGLVLAGANHRALAGDDEEDGILTAAEIGALDLSGVEWAVLSGCDTGVGEIRVGEGIFGLRRAFEVAGVGTLITSLWPVEDESASRWMKELYEGRLLRGLSTADAVHQAHLTTLNQRRDEGASTHPFFWAGFVAAGDWR